MYIWIHVRTYWAHYNLTIIQWSLGLDQDENLTREFLTVCSLDFVVLKKNVSQFTPYTYVTYVCVELCLLIYVYIYVHVHMQYVHMYHIKGYLACFQHTKMDIGQNLGLLK